MTSKTGKYLVLDLDESLLRTSDSEDPKDTTSLENTKIMSNPKHYRIRKRLYMLDLVDVVDEKGSGVDTIMWGIYRNNLKEFLTFSQDYFEGIIIWSAGRHGYVHGVVEKMFLNMDDPYDIFTWDDCDIDPEDGLLTKPLRKIYEKHPRINPKNCLVIDDKLSTFSENPNNGIHIPAYMPSEDIIEMMENDDRLMELIKWFEKPQVKNSKDVRRLKKDNIFRNFVPDNE